MVEACLELGVDVMTGHWEFTYGADRVRELIDGPMRDRIALVAQNIRTRDFDDEVFPGYVTRDCNGVRVAIIGQAFPYTPIANPRHLVPDWAFGIREESLQQMVDTVRADGAQVVVLLSHNGMDVDLEMASRIAGLTAILGGHTHDGVPVAIEVANPGGKTLVTNGGSNGKFVGVLDLDVRDKQVRDYRYRLVPVFSDLLSPDAAMQALVDRVRAPYRDRLAEPLAVTEGTLYRRGNFNGTFDQVIVDALMRVKDVPIAFSPGFRWGASLLAGDTITREDVMAQTAITYPAVTVTPMTGERIRAVLEDVADNLFHPHPYYQQGGDMVRVGGLTFSCEPRATVGQRIGDLRVGDKPLDPARTYPVAGWASVAEGATGEPIWDVVETYLRDRKVITPPKLNTPRLLGVDGDPGFSPP
jgi:sulfur-oxidizing protein SoxB